MVKSLNEIWSFRQLFGQLLAILPYQASCHDSKKNLDVLTILEEPIPMMYSHFILHRRR